MADIANKYTENVSGKFYVDDQCIDKEGTLGIDRQRVTTCSSRAIVRV